MQKYAENRRKTIPIFYFSQMYPLRSSHSLSCHSALQFLSRNDPILIPPQFFKGLPLGWDSCHFWNPARMLPSDHFQIPSVSSSVNPIQEPAPSAKNVVLIKSFSSEESIFTNWAPLFEEHSNFALCQDFLPTGRWMPTCRTPLKKKKK